MKLYVAYGSNLNKVQMAERCPDARAIATGELINWELIYRGSKTGAYCSVQKKNGKTVPVALWQISKRDESRLDTYEGFPRFYQKQNVYVALEDGSQVKAMIYTMRSDAKPGLPSRSYVDTVLQGYIDFGLN